MLSEAGPDDFHIVFLCILLLFVYLSKELRPFFLLIKLKQTYVDQSKLRGLQKITPHLTTPFRSLRRTNTLLSCSIPNRRSFQLKKSDKWSGQNETFGISTFAFRSSGFALGFVLAMRILSFTLADWPDGTLMCVHPDV